MNIDGANNFSESNDYTVYTMNSAEAGQYAVVLPKNSSDNMNMLVDLHMKNLFDGIANGSKTKDEVINLVNGEYANIKDKYPNSILVFPMLDDSLLAGYVSANDKQKMFDEVKKIGAITSEIYKKLIDNGIDKSKINQKIVMMEKNDDDNKFVDWLKEQMPNFVDGYSYEEKKEEFVNPFGVSLDENKASVEVPVEESEPVVEVPSDIFSNSVETSNEETPVPAVEETPVVSEPVVEENKEPVLEDKPIDIFSNSNPAPEVETPVPAVEEKPVVSEPVVEDKPIDIFSAPTPAPEVETPVPAVEEKPVVSEPIATTPAEPIVSSDGDPKPVESQELNGTTTFSPITPETVDNSQVSEPAKTNKSGGFANLIIILVILVGVTIVSVELGKYLYSIYGA